MRTPQIIPVEELGKAALLFDAVGRWAQVDPFVLHGPPQALDEDVVVAAPASIHADLDPVIPQHLGELVAGELRALIGIEDAGLAEPGERLAQRLDTEPCRQRVRQPPGQHPSGCPVDDRDQVQKPLLHRYVRYVSCPYPAFARAGSGSAGRSSCRAEDMDRPCARDAACWCSVSACPPTARASSSAAGPAGGQPKSPHAAAPPGAGGCRRPDGL